MIGKPGGLDCGKKPNNQVTGCQRNYESVLIEKVFLWIFILTHSFINQVFLFCFYGSLGLDFHLQNIDSLRRICFGFFF